MAKAPQGQHIPTTVVLPPQTALQLGGESLHSITSALGTQPLLLVIVLLNIVFAVVGGYFLLQLEKYRADNLSKMIDVIKYCVSETVPVKPRETINDH